MKKLILPFLVSFITITSYAQTKGNNPTLNFGFETADKGTPTGWNNFGSPTYSIALDSTNVKTGKYAATIELKAGTPEFKAWAFTIPNNYAGKKITLTGFMKTENVTDGYAGLWMRIDPNIAFDNMNSNGIKGTTDWTKYKITLDMNPEKTRQIVFGGLLVGKGKMWLDDFSVSIDGKEIKDLKPFEQKLVPADSDHEFDKGSGISKITVDNNNIENLKALCLIWGFLKYHHPSVAKGNYNWDYELFRIIPKVLSSTNKTNRDELLVKWIEGLGEFTQGPEPDFKSSDVKMKPDLDWIGQSGFSTALSSLLLKVKNAKRAKQHYYIGLHAGVGNPEFKNENAYSSVRYPDAGIRLLTLYRYWNMIQYYFPYKNLVEEDWKNVLVEFIPKLVNANDETAYTLSVLELIGRIHDTHANIWGANQVLTNYLGVRYAPVEITFVEGKPVVTRFYDEKFGKETGLAIGDVISSINNKPVDGIVKDRLKYTPASNYPTKLRDIASSLLRTNDSTIEIEFTRNSTTERKTIKTFTSKQISIYRKFQATDTCFRLINKDIAYINNGSLKRDYLPAMWKDMENTKGVIIDIRNYPSDFAIYDLTRYLVPESKPFVKFTKGNIESPGFFTYGKTINAGKPNRNYYKGKVVLIVNDISQSSAEFHTMAYQLSPNATVIGSTTAGADGNVSSIVLPGGISTMISGIGVYYPDGKETQRIGIVPDIEVKPTVRGIKNGEDELLNKAIEIINGK